MVKGSVLPRPYGIFRTAEGRDLRWLLGNGFHVFDQGPALIVVGGVLGDHTQQAGLAQLLASDFTVYNVDRRGHGESGFTAPYAVEREVEDLDAVLTQAGGSACVYGTSGPGVLCMEAAARGLSPKIKKLAVWEPPTY